MRINTDFFMFYRNLSYLTLLVVLFMGFTSQAQNVTISATDAAAAEVTPSTETGFFTIDLGAPNPNIAPIIVNYTITGTAANGTDYAMIGNSVSILNGQQRAEVTIVPVDDTTLEVTEDVILTLATGTGYTIALAPDDTATVNITDNDLTNVSVTLNDGIASEVNASDQGLFLISLGGLNGTGSDIVINYELSGTATNTDDYITLTGSVAISDGFSIAGVSITAVDDNLVEGDEIATLTLLADVAYNLTPFIADRTADITIIDNDRVTISINDPVAVLEGNSGIAMLNFSVSIDQADPVNPITVNYTVAGGNENGTINPVTFLVGTTILSQTITVTTNGDTLIEPSEAITVTLSNPSSNAAISTTDNVGSSSFTDDDTNCLGGFTQPVLNTSIPIAFCDIITRSLNEYTSSTAPSGSVLTWSTDEDPLNVSAHLNATQVSNPPTVGGSFYAFFYDATNLCASPTLLVDLVINPTPIITATTGDQICGSGEVTLTVAGNTPDAVQLPIFNWYDALTGGSLVSTGPSFTTNIAITTSFYVEAMANQCTSSRIEVIAMVNEQPLGGIELNAVSCNVVAGGPTITDLDNTIIGNDIANYAGVWTVATDPSGAIAIDSENNVDFEGLVDGDYIFTFSTTNAQAPCTNASVNVIISVTDCNPPPTDLSIEKTVDFQSPTIGDEVKFTITVTNLTLGSVTNVEVNELINDASGFRYLSVETSNGTYDENTGIWSLPEIAPEEVNTLEITVRVLNSGSYRNIATIASSLPVDSNEDNNEAQVILTPIDGECGIVYNQFSPNGDGRNDFFSISCIDSFVNNSLEVYNRYGNKVYEAKPYQDRTWDGTGNSGDLPLGTYFYILDLGDDSEVRKGWIQIIR